MSRKKQMFALFDHNLLRIKRVASRRDAMQQFKKDDAVYFIASEIPSDRSMSGWTIKKVIRRRERKGVQER